MRRALWTVLAGALALGGAAVGRAEPYPEPLVETPSLLDEVRDGDLPPVEWRIPDEPLVVDLEARGRVPGLHGGDLTTFVSRSKDVRYMAVWGYARLVGYDENYELVPDILRDVEVTDGGRTFTLHLRRGHKWSDGEPFTTRDFEYWWKDVALNPELSPAGPPVEMLADGARPEVTVIDTVTIRYSWPKPNPQFLPALAQARPVYIYRPMHYMRRFHADYADPEGLAERVAAADKNSWAALHNYMDALYDFDNPDLPVLQPWVNRTDKNSQRYTLVRNPFYHRIDTAGRQLPYVDAIDMVVAAGGLIPLKTSMGEAALQIRSLGFADAPVLKKNEDAKGYRTHLWQSGAANEVALYPNLNYADPAWRTLFRDVRFRRALSLGISRKAINKVLFFGLAEERAVAALEESPFFDPEQATAWAHFDIDQANRLLDELGLVERNPAGIRRLPDGRLMEIVVETAGERQEEEDVLELIAATWEQLGIRLHVKPQDRDVLRNRAYSGRAMMVAWYGWNIGIPTADIPPVELAPVDQATLSWPMWGQYYQTKGSAGEPPDLPEAQRLMELYDQWSMASTDAEKADAWREMLAIHADQVFAIGTIARAPVPLVHDAALRNVPDQAIYAWDPGGQLGVHRMDEFFFEGGRSR
jgi:peptide/nickel transport system substrate-binding protein